mgnify:CR=1 FL=1|tara:strand:- start:1670 stop:1996 length:327 start_codon:yes stop_codon:yes gene_type:complete
MKSSIYVARILPVEDRIEAPRIHVRIKEAKKSFEYLCKYARQEPKSYWSRVELVRYTFTGNPQTAIASAIEVGSVISRGQYITLHSLCDGVCETELLNELEPQEVENE